MWLVRWKRREKAARGGQLAAASGDRVSYRCPGINSASTGLVIPGTDGVECEVEL